MFANIEKRETYSIFIFRFIFNIDQSIFNIDQYWSILINIDRFWPNRFQYIWGIQFGPRWILINIDNIDQYWEYDWKYWSIFQILLTVLINILNTIDSIDQHFEYDLQYWSILRMHIVEIYQYWFEFIQNIECNVHNIDDLLAVECRKENAAPCWIQCAGWLCCSSKTTEGFWS